MKFSDDSILSNLKGVGYMVLFRANNSWHMKGNSYGFPYSQVWSAKRYGCPYWGTVKEWCVMDMSKGDIVWRSWEDSSQE